VKRLAITALRHALPVLAIILAVWGVGFFHTACCKSFGLWDDHGIVGAACWLLAALAVFCRRRLPPR
jgi:hypothetical protein